MRERGILMSAPNVRSILAGIKSQTRRVVKPRPNADGLANYWEVNPPPCPGPHDAGYWINSDDERVNCPYGVAGDRLWCRETWMDLGMICLYRADANAEHERKLVANGQPWRPSIFMPRWASRLTLEITDVRVERLQEISESDAMAEGITHSTMNDPRVEYRWLWESINGPGSWDINPYVWAITFRRIGDA